MATWAKVKFFHKTMLGSTGSTLVATSTEADNDYDVDYIFNWLETNLWKAEDSGVADPQYITYDAGAGNTESADYVVILGHNLNTAGVTVTLQYSTDDFTGDINDAFTGIVVSADTVFSKEFTSQDKRYWRLKLSGHGATAPCMTLAVWGEATELDYMSSSIDPYADDIKATVNRTQGGYVSGIHVKHTMRNFNLTFDATDITTYDKVRAWRDDHGLQNFFLAWETANNPTEVWLMRPSGGTFSAPYSDFNTERRDVNIQLEGRKE